MTEAVPVMPISDKFVCNRRDRILNTEKVVSLPAFDLIVVFPDCPVKKPHI